MSDAGGGEISPDDLCLRSIDKFFGEQWVLRDVNLTFPRGGITAIVGRSGCGKSTLLKLCNGLHTPDRGEIHVFGSPIDYRALPNLRRSIGYAVQGNVLFPHLTARDNICLAASLTGWANTEIEQRLVQLLDMAQLEPDYLSRYPHELSGGQQQRVGLCRAMMMRPRLLLLDEPFGALDPITRVDVHEQLLSMHRREPITTLLVTHDMREALSLADNVVVMAAGRIVAAQSPEALRLAQPGVSPELLLKALLEGVQG